MRAIGRTYLRKHTSIKKQDLSLFKGLAGWGYYLLKMGLQRQAESILLPLSKDKNSESTDVKYWRGKDLRKIINRNNYPFLTNTQKAEVDRLPKNYPHNSFWILKPEEGQELNTIEAIEQKIQQVKKKVMNNFLFGLHYHFHSGKVQYSGKNQEKAVSNQLKTNPFIAFQKMGRDLSKKELKVISERTENPEYPYKHYALLFPRPSNQAIKISIYFISDLDYQILSCFASTTSIKKVQAYFENGLPISQLITNYLQLGILQEQITSDTFENLLELEVL